MLVNRGWFSTHLYIDNISWILLPKSFRVSLLRQITHWCSYEDTLHLELPTPCWERLFQLIKAFWPGREPIIPLICRGHCDVN